VEAQLTREVSAGSADGSGSGSGGDGSGQEPDPAVINLISPNGKQRYV